MVGSITEKNALKTLSHHIVSTRIIAAPSVSISAVVADDKAPVEIR